MDLELLAARSIFSSLYREKAISARLYEIGKDFFQKKEAEDERHGKMKEKEGTKWI